MRRASALAYNPVFYLNARILTYPFGAIGSDDEKDLINLAADVAYRTRNNIPKEFQLQVWGWG